MKLDVNKPQLTIMGVKFNNQEEFRGALYAISSNMIEGWQPTKQDVEQVKDYLILKQKEKSDD
ncbi:MULTISPECIES: hypothetical protein [unclassified Oceanobacillus]|uniref:hypothetical protein n=1 Tax=unclassified Oceanobacillus TaxID=2630292 RepID=UPI00300E06F0